MRERKRGKREQILGAKMQKNRTGEGPRVQRNMEGKNNK
jgi:hypothetical protein